jgi:hypothetical protein
MSVEVRIVPPRQGWLWVLQGFKLLRAHPALWLLNLLFYWLCLVVVSNLPYIGAVLASVLIPGFSAGFMLACRFTQLGRPPQPAHLIAPFRANPRPQLLLGVAYVIALVLVLGLSALLDGGVLFRLMLIGGRVTEETVRSSGLQWAGLAAMALFAPVLLAFWFAPALCLWHAMTPGKALFFSFFAGLRNTRAFLVYGLGWVLFAAVVPMLLGLILGVVLPQRRESVALVALLMTPYMLAVVCAMMCSFYSSYAAIFGEPAESPPAGASAP